MSAAVGSLVDDGMAVELPLSDSPMPAPSHSAAEGTRLVHEALAARYLAPEWFVGHEVMCGSRRLDAVAIRSWAQAVIHAVEIKASRSDWLREMARPDKADVALPFADHFWLAIADKSIARMEEIPDHWGLLVLQSNGKLRAAKAAPDLRPHVPNRDFWASMILRAYQGSDARDVEKLEREAHGRGYADGRKAAHASMMEEQRREDFQTQEANALKEAFGWHARDLIAAAPRLLSLLEVDRAPKRAAYMVRDLRRIADEIEALGSGDKP